MNAMGSNTSILNLFMSLGQGLGDDTGSLGPEGEEGGLFSSLLADFGLSEEDLSSLQQENGDMSATLSALQGLPLQEQALPLSYASLPLSAGQLPEPGTGLTDFSDLAPVDDSSSRLQSVLQQIAQGRNPIPVRDVAAAGDDSDHSEPGIEGAPLTEISGADSGADESLLSALPLSAQVTAGNGQTQSGGQVSQPLQDRTRTPLQERRLSMTADSADGQQTDSPTGTLTTGEEEADSDIFIPVTDKSAKESQASGSPGLNGQLQMQPQTQPQLQPQAATSADTSAFARMTEDAASVTDAVEEFTESDADNTLEEFHKNERLAARDKLDFGSDSQKWGPALGSRIVTMVAEGVQEARIQLDPPELGSMELKLQVHQDQTSVQVQVQNNQVRDVLEANAQRLRDALAQQGMTLSGFDVSTQSGSSQQQSGQPGSDGNDQYGSDGVLTTDDESSLQEPRGVVSAVNSLLDTFA